MKTITAAKPHGNTDYGEWRLAPGGWSSDAVNGKPLEWEMGEGRWAMGDGRGQRLRDKGHGAERPGQGPLPIAHCPSPISLAREIAKHARALAACCQDGAVAKANLESGSVVRRPCHDVIEIDDVRAVDADKHGGIETLLELAQRRVDAVPAACRVDIDEVIAGFQAFYRGRAERKDPSTLANEETSHGRAAA